MSPVFATRRRAEEFNTLVESSTDLGDPRYADVRSLVEQLRALEPPAPRPDFTLALRERLMAEADTVLLPAPDTRSADAERLTLPRRTARDRRIAAAVGAVAILGASTSIAVAAQSALPGEMLYPIKRLLETAETGAQLSDSGKGSSLLENAADRLAEVTALSRTSDLDEADTIAATLTTFSEQSLEASDFLLDDYAAGGDRSSVESLNQFTVSSMETLAQLEAVLPPGARDELQEAAQVLVEIDSAASAACPMCRGGLDQLPVALQSVGQLSEPAVVVPPLVEEQPADEAGRQPGTGDKQKDARGGNGGSGSLDLPEVPATGGTDTGDAPTDPLDDLLDGVTGQGGETASNGGGGSGGNGGGGGNVIDDTVDTVEEVIDLLEDPLAP
ncbi:MAG: DUF5667 domain-containing protein [Nocardioides sp.]